MNRSRFNSPVFSTTNRNNSPDSNWQSKNSGFKESLSPDFIPFEYSSPLSSFKSNDNRNKRHYHRGSMRINRNFNSPQSCSSGFNSPYNSSGFNQSGDNRKNNFRNNWNTSNNPNNSTYNSKMYFSDSMLCDPWEDLERLMKKEKDIIDVQEKSSNNESGNDESVESSSSENEDGDSSSSSPDDKIDTPSSASTTLLNTTTSSDG